MTLSRVELQALRKAIDVALPGMDFETSGLALGAVSRLMEEQDWGDALVKLGMEKPATEKDIDVARRFAFVQAENSRLKMALLDLVHSCGEPH